MFVFQLMHLALLPWIILFLPLAAAALITLFTQRNRAVSATLSVGAVVVGFILSVIFVRMGGWQPELSGQASPVGLHSRVYYARRSSHAPAR